METVATIVHFSAVAAFLLVLAYGGLSDLATFEIPNWVSVVLCAAFVPAGLAAGWGGGVLLMHGLAGGAMLGVGIALFAAGIVGGGDAKLLAATAVWSGWGLLPALLLLMALGGGVLALFLIAFRRWPLAGRLAGVAWVRRLHGEAGVPYGLAIAAGGIILSLRLPVVLAATG